MIPVANRVARAPELRRHPRIGAVLQQPAQFSPLDLVANLGAELKVEPFVVNGPTAVRLHVEPIVGVGDQVVEGPLTRLDGDVGHTDERDAVPARSTHRAARAGQCRVPALKPRQLHRRFPRCEVAHKQPLPHQFHPLRWHTLVVPAEGAQAARQCTVGGEVDGRGTVAEGTEFVGREETGAGVGRLGAEDTVQFGGMAARFVHL